MATRRKKPEAPAALAVPSDPRAPLDGALLLKEARPVLKLLAEDLLGRADGSPAVTAALKHRHDVEKARERTADEYPEWRRGLVDQVAAAWFLSCVFVRTLEDRGLLDRARLAGPGAKDSQGAFFALAPSLNERDYLHAVFRELGRLSAAGAELFDARHNPALWLGPSAEAARQLLGFFRTPSIDAPAFRFGGPDTRFLGDLYQDLNEAVRKRYALLQTPRFVEEFILDRTLERALDRFGLDETNLLDPTCGSGHFLLGAFDRLFERRLQAEPGLDRRQAALKALDAVAGADINPYAVAIARFRLTLSFLEKAGLPRLRGVAKLPLHVAVADSLLHNPQHQQTSFADLPGTDLAAWKGTEFALEDPEAARDVLGKEYAAVVGNPPYITVKDPVLRERYRGMYPKSAAGKYSVAAPFTERFFQAARKRGTVGMITANSFMKREFGKKLIEDYLPSVNLDIVINTSGAFIPGHGTPTVLLFGTAEPSQGTDVLTVLASRGEPSTPDDPEKGLVWSSVAQHWDGVGFENEYISVVRTERRALEKHPWSLGGGGAAELKELLEERAEARLKDVVEDIGFASFTGLDDAFILPAHAARVLGIEDALVRPMVVGESVRDWAVTPSETAIVPYGLADQEPLPLDPAARWARFLWRYRTTAKNVASFGGKTRDEEGQNWWEWYRWQTERYRSPFRITFAFVATHNHFVLDRGGKVFKQSAPIIKLPESATEDDHLALLAYLNSSTACFWMKQVIHNKTNASQKHSTDPARAAYEFAGTALEALPFLALPDVSEPVRQLLATGEARAQWLSGAALAAEGASVLTSLESLRAWLAAGWTTYDNLTARAVYLQEELDWLVYERAGLLAPGQAEVRFEPNGTADPGSRPFELSQGYDSGVSARARRSDATAATAQMPEHWRCRLDLLRREHIATLEDRGFKRMWRVTEQNIDQEEYRRNVPREWVTAYLTQAVEDVVRTAPVSSAREIERRLDRPVLGTVAEYLGDSSSAVTLKRLLAVEAVPYLSTLTFTDTGLEKRSAWEATWDAQRREDRGASLGTIPIPPQYSQGSRGKSTDYREPTTWRLRGKLDVPKERFISYPGCESDLDGEPVYGWAGWDHLQRAVALAELYMNRKTQEGWKPERLQPMLAGVLELLPWLQQWHSEPSEELGGARPSEQFAQFLDAECAELGFTRDDLRAWRPPARGRAAKTASQPKAEKAPKAPRRKRSRAEPETDE